MSFFQGRSVWWQWQLKGQQQCCLRANRTWDYFWVLPLLFLIPQEADLSFDLFPRGSHFWVSVNRKGRWNGGFIDTSLLSQIRQQVRKIQHCYQLLNHHLMSLFVLSFVHSRLCSLNWSVNWSLIFLSSLWAHAHTDNIFELWHFHSFHPVRLCDSQTGLFDVVK